jgi:hypothetical protein
MALRMRSRMSSLLSTLNQALSSFWKKAWSYFMLNQITPWNEISHVGNPTCSTVVNKIIKAMKKMEAARLGRPSQARWAFQPMEF